MSIWAWLFAGLLGVVVVLGLIALLARALDRTAEKRGWRDVVAAKPLIIALGAFVVLFAAGLWWAQTQAYYKQDAYAQWSIESDAGPIAVRDARRLWAQYNPLRERACFTLADPLPEALPLAHKPRLLTTPSWFDCFDAERLDKDISSGAVRVYVARENVSGFSTLLAVYPDGRGYIWPQLAAE